MVAASSDLHSYIASSDGACVVALVVPEEPELATVALRAARRQLLAVPHPEEPDEAFVSYVSAVATKQDRALLWFDAADVESYPGISDQLVEALIEATTAIVGDDGELVPAPDEMPTRERRPRQKLPPEGFPIPDFVVVASAGGRLFTMATEANADDVRDYFLEQLPLAGFNLQATFAVEGALPYWTFRGTVIQMDKDGIVSQLIIYEYGELLVQTSPEEEADFVRRRAARQPALLECYWGSSPLTPGFHDLRP